MRVDAERRAKDNPSTSTALTLFHYVDAEHDANVDFVWGEGTSRRWAEERAALAARRRGDADAYARWAEANPEDARAADRRRRSSTPREREGRYDPSAYWAGFDAAETISLDQQVSAPKPRGLL